MNEKVKQALENLKTIRFYVGACSEQVCEYFKQIEKTLNDFDKYHESQQDLIKGKDEYIAKLCNDRAELKEHENELIKEQNRLFDLCKEQEKALKIIVKKDVEITGIKYFKKIGDYNVGMDKDQLLTYQEFRLVKKVVEKYGKER